MENIEYTIQAGKLHNKKLQNVSSKLAQENYLTIKNT